MLVMYVKFNDTFGSKIKYTLARISTVPIKNDFLICIGFRIFTVIILIFDRIPNNTDRSEIKCSYLVWKINKTRLNCPINTGSSCHSLARIESFRWFDIEGISYNLLYQRYPRCATNQLDRVKLTFGSDSTFYVAQCWG